jgi:hypothetical protein
MQQAFRVESPTGVGAIKHRESGRCLAVKNCDVDNPAGGAATGGVYHWGEVVLDSCSSACAKWTAVPDHTSPTLTMFTGKFPGDIY